MPGGVHRFEVRFDDLNLWRLRVFAKGSPATAPLASETTSRELPNSAT
jgi:hypothetical protein